MIYYWQDEIESIYTSGAYHNWTTPSDLYNSKYVGRTIGLQDLRFEALNDLLLCTDYGYVPVQSCSFVQARYKQLFSSNSMG
jgi:hypothetical protein